VWQLAGKTEVGRQSETLMQQEDEKVLIFQESILKTTWKQGNRMTTSDGTRVTYSASPDQLSLRRILKHDENICHLPSDSSSRTHEIQLRGNYWLIP
jgi:hypothetical protein